MCETTEVVDLVATVDRLGEVLALKANLVAEEEQLKATLKGAGLDVIEGVLFRATISRYSQRKVDYKAIVEVLQPSHQLISGHTNFSPVVNVRVSSRKGK